MKFKAEKILNDEYGVGVVPAPSCAVLWACAKCEDPESELKEVNRIKAKHGAPLAYAPYQYFETLELTNG